jgi:saccharopine dehydrogenase-like NADP-dependent oxidoreductase
MGYTVLLAGFGMQGNAVLHDLFPNGRISRILVADKRPDLHARLGRYPSNRVRGVRIDAADERAMTALMRDADVVVEALPGTMALPVGRMAVESGASLVSSMYYLNPGEQDPAAVRSLEEQIRELDRRAAGKGLVILTEFGLDPGLDLILAARAIRELDSVRSFFMYGAGIPGPNARGNPLQYKFSWSVIGVMRAYRRPARIISSGNIVSVEPTRLFEEGAWHTLQVAETGAPLECFPNGDAVHYAELLGIRDTVQEMGRYTCRLPGHCAFWDKLVKCGFLDEQPLESGGSIITPMQFTASLLGSQGQFQYADGEEDMALIRLDAGGMRGGRPFRVIYQLLDTRDPKTGFTAMQRTVGFTMSLGAQLILEGRLPRKGLLTPLDVPFEAVIPQLERDHSIRVVRQEAPVDV